jgi:hypothetical protein
MTIGKFFHGLWKKIGALIRPMALLISSLIIANGAVITILINQLIGLNRSVGVIEGTIGGLPEDKRTVIVRLEKLESGQTDLRRDLAILTSALGDTPRDLMLAAEKVKDIFAAFDQILVNVATMLSRTESFDDRLQILQERVDQIGGAIYDKETGLLRQASDINREIGAIRNRLETERPP